MEWPIHVLTGKVSHERVETSKNIFTIDMLFQIDRGLDMAGCDMMITYMHAGNLFIMASQRIKKILL